MTNELLEVARANVAKAVALCGAKDVPFNAVSDSDPVIVAQDRISRIDRARRVSPAMAAERQAWAEWLESR